MPNGLTMEELLGPNDGPYVRRADQYCAIECMDCGIRLEDGYKRSGRCLPCWTARKTNRKPQSKRYFFIGGKSD